MPDAISLQARVPDIDAAAPAIARRDLLLRWGAVVLKDAASRETIAAVEAALAGWFARAPTGEGLFLGRRTRRFSGLLAKAEATANLIAETAVLELVEPILKGGGCDAIQLGLTQAIAIEPGERAQFLHRDDTLYPCAKDGELLINAMWPLDAFTPANGATRIVLGSQNWDRTVRPKAGAGVSAAASPGDVILWLGSVLHGGGENSSAACRRGLVFQYSAAWLAQAEKLLLTTPPEVARRLPTRVQKLIGYQVHRPNLGWIEERDPLEWLNGATGAVAAAQDHFTSKMQAQLETALQRGEA